MKSINQIVEEYKRKLEDVLDEYFPKMYEETPAKIANKRSQALMLYTEAVLNFRKELEARDGEIRDSLCATLKHDAFCAAKGKQYKECALCYIERKLSVHPHEEKGCKHANCGRPFCESATCRNFKCHTKD